MNFETSNRTLRQLLGNGLQYCVPPFQRDYSWTDEEWDDLWQDIESLFAPDGEAAHYMGYLVLQSSNNKNFDIIDGQQRLTTFSLLVLAVLSALQELVDLGYDAHDNARRIEQLRNAYIGYLDPVSLVPQSKLKLNRHNDKFFQHQLVPLQTLPQRGLKPSEHQLRKAFLWFRDRIKTKFGRGPKAGIDLAQFLDTLVDKMFFTVITVTDELNAFKVFETLNARGQRLSATDLLKNYLFSLISSEQSYENELQALEERWEAILDTLKSENMPEFLRIYWNSKYKLVRKADLFKTIRKHIQTRAEAHALLWKLMNATHIYVALRDPTDTQTWNSDERMALSQLKMFNVRQPMAMLMACYQGFYEGDRAGFTRILQAVSVFTFRYNVICNLPAREQETLYNQIAIGVSQQDLKTTRQVIASLLPLYPEDKIFLASFSTKQLRTTSQRNKTIVRYILFELERYLYNNSFDAESATYSLEHILPENPDESWDTIEEPTQDSLIFRLGNLTILETKANREAGNQDYAAKLKAYSHSKLGITRAIAEHYHKWDAKSLEARQHQMAKQAAGRWRINF